MSDDLLKIGLQGIEKLNKIADGLEADANIQAILDEGAAVVYNHIRTRFLQMMAPDGTPWPVSKAALRRQRKNLGGGTLFDKGNLFRSLQLYAPDGDSRAIGTDVSYAKFHQFGTIHLPKRVFLGFGQDDEQAMQDAVIHRLSQILQGVTS